MGRNYRTVYCVVRIAYVMDTTADKKCVNKKRILNINTKDLNNNNNIIEEYFDFK